MVVVYCVEDAYNSSVSDGWEFPPAESCLKHQHYRAAASPADDESKFDVLFVMSVIASAGISFFVLSPLFGPVCMW